MGRFEDKILGRIIIKINGADIALHVVGNDFAQPCLAHRRPICVGTVARQDAGEAVPELFGRAVADAGRSQDAAPLLLKCQERSGPAPA